MAIDLDKLPGFIRVGTKEDEGTRKTPPGIEQYRKMVEEKINNHIRVYVDNKAVMVDVLDDMKEPTGKKRKERVLCLSQPAKGINDAVACKLKYSAAKIIDIGSGENPLIVEKTKEREFWLNVKELVETGALDKEIMAAAKTAAPVKKKDQV